MGSQTNAGKAGAESGVQAGSGADGEEAGVQAGGSGCGVERGTAAAGASLMEPFRVDAGTGITVSSMDSLDDAAQPLGSYSIYDSLER